MSLRSWICRSLSSRRTPGRPGFGRRLQLEALEDRWLPSVYLVTNTLDAGSGSLRQAILDANANPGPNTIDFNIAGSGVHTIAVGDTTGLPLPIITDAVAIDGYSQSGASINTLTVGDNAVLMIQLDGSSLGAGFNALHITAGNSTVRGLMIDNFARTAGPSFAGGNAILMDTNGGNVVIGCILGTHGSGGAGTFSNGNSDITVGAGSSDNVIGGSTPDARNVISGAQAGTVITAGSGRNFFEGNYVGTDPGGTRAVPNFDGLEGSGTGDTIGGTASGARNVFSGNGRAGVDMAFAVNDVVEGNLIGINAQGDAVLSNFRFGVLASGGSGDVIGGPAPGAGNVIGGLSGFGIEIDDSGAPAGTNGYLVQGNFLGTDRTGMPNFGNAFGILLAGEAVTQGVANTTVAGNVIANESGVGVEILGAGARNNLVEGNYVGTDPTDMLAHSIFANANLGIELVNGGNNNQSAPQLSSAVAGGGVTTVQGTFTGQASTTYTLEFFAADSSGQGQQFLGSLTVTTDDNGLATFTFNDNAQLPLGQLVTATATDPVNNTSAFAQAVAVTG